MQAITGNIKEETFHFRKRLTRCEKFSSFFLFLAIASFAAMFDAVIYVYYYAWDHNLYPWTTPLEVNGPWEHIGPLENGVGVILLTVLSSLIFLFFSYVLNPNRRAGWLSALWIGLLPFMIAIIFNVID